MSQPVFLIYREGSMIAPERRATLPEAMAEAEREALAHGGEVHVCVSVTRVVSHAVSCDGEPWPLQPGPGVRWR